jgi:hypothetical protein
LNRLSYAAEYQQVVAVVPGRLDLVKLILPEVRKPRRLYHNQNPAVKNKTNFLLNRLDVHQRTNYQNLISVARENLRFCSSQYFLGSSKAACTFKG